MHIKFIILLIFIITALVLRGYSAELLIASCVFSLVSILIIFYFWQKKGLLTWACGIPIFYLFYFVIAPLILNDIGSNTWYVQNSLIADAFWCALIGLISFASGVILFSSVYTSSKSIYSFKIFQVLEDFRGIVVIIVLGGGASVMSIFFGYTSVSVDSSSAISPFSGLISVISFFLPVGMLAAWSKYYLNNDFQFYRLGMFALIFMVSVGVFSNSKGAILLPVVLVSILKFGFTRRLPVKELIIFFILYFFFAYPIISSFRTIQLLDLMDSERMYLLKAYINYIFSGEWINFVDNNVAGSDLSRGLLLFFSKIISETGSVVSYFSGDTYLHALNMFVPRFIMPDKLSSNIGNIFGQHYLLLHESDTITNVSPTFMGEFFANFGVVGLLLGMFIMGIISVLVDKFLITKRISWLMPIMIMQINWQESIFGHTFLPFLKNILMLFIVCYVLNKLMKINKKY